MDPFSIATAVIGLSGGALSSISSLHKAINDLGDAQEEVRDIRTHLEGIQAPLRALQAVSNADEETQAEYREALAKTGIINAVNECGKACEVFETKLKKWTKDSTDKKLSLRDKMSVGMWNKEKIRTFKTRVETCQRTVHFAVSSTQLLLQERASRKSEASNEILSQQMQNLELQAQSQMELIKKQQEEIERREGEFAGESGSDDEENAQVAKVADEVREQSWILDEMQVSLGVVFAQLRACRTHQEIGTVVTDQKSMALVGIPERLVGKIDQRIGNVLTTNNSASMVGVFDQSVDLNSFFKRS
ncbi:hypothetical protein Q7P37_007754 [Cladosporium fusiforme]